VHLQRNSVGFLHRGDDLPRPTTGSAETLGEIVVPRVGWVAYTLETVATPVQCRIGSEGRLLRFRGVSFRATGEILRIALPVVSADLRGILTPGAMSSLDEREGSVESVSQSIDIGKA